MESKWHEQPRKQLYKRYQEIHEWPTVNTETVPSCQYEEDTRLDIIGKRCQAALLDKTENKVLIIRENVPIELRRWGFPKGKYKIGESDIDCSHREICEEVGIVVDDYPHIYRKMGANQVIIFYEHYADEILIHIGPEVLATKWVNLNWLKKDSKIAPWGTYNATLRDFIMKI